MTGTATTAVLLADSTGARRRLLPTLTSTMLAATFVATAVVGTGCSSGPFARRHSPYDNTANSMNSMNSMNSQPNMVSSSGTSASDPVHSNVHPYQTGFPTYRPEPAYMGRNETSSTSHGSNSSNPWNSSNNTNYSNSTFVNDSVVFSAPAFPSGDKSIGVYGEPASLASLVSDTIDGAGNMAQITHTTEGACFDPNTSRDGKRIVFASTQHRATADIYVKSTTGKTVTQITQDPAEDVMPAFAPDGDRIAFSSNRDGNWNLYITSINGGPPMQLTNDFDHELHPTWSPDGRYIAYCKLGSQSGRWEVWITDLDSRVPQFLDYGLFPEWNPDPARSKIAFQRARERGSRLFSIWTFDYVDGEALHPTEIVSAANAAAMHPSWSPDGTRLVFVTVTNPSMAGNIHPDQSDVWVVNIDGTSKANLTGGQYRNLYPVWAADGAVYFLSNRSGIDNIWSVATGRTIDLPLANEHPLVNVDPASERSDSNR